MGNKVSEIKETRTIEVGVIKDSDKKKINKIVTSKYTPLTFIPKNLMEQFRRLANFYFLIVGIIALIIDSPVTPLTSILPLVFVILVTMAKQGYEDWLRHKSDHLVNNELVSVIRNSTLQQIESRKLRPGELLKISCDSDVPCDAILLWTSDTRGKSFVTTANLDGETSLKTLKVPTVLDNIDIENKHLHNILIEILPPEADIYTFYGKLSVDEKCVPINTENLLLRGSRIKNTEWVIGCAIYTGEETKLSLNSKFKSNKFTSSESNINNFLVFFMVIMIIEIIVSYFLKRYYERAHVNHKYLGEADSDNSFKSIAQDTFSFLLLYFYSIPISLYVTIEMHKFIGSKFFEWDNDLLCTETGQKPLVNSSDLNEELGQIEILFCDKTGTLTKNDMYFQTCSINGVLYIEKNKKLFEVNEEWRRGDMVQAEEAMNPDVEFFFTILALCHTVQVEDGSTKNKLLNGNNNYFKDNVENIPTYQAMSSDEIAFVKAAANRGIIFNGDDINNLFIKYNNGKVMQFKKLQLLEFTSSRRRMSVIVKYPNEKIFLFCKGAESAVLPLCLDSELIAITDEHVQNFAEQGLRTLTVAYKELTEEEYRSIDESISRHNLDIQRKLSRDQTNDIWREIENGLILIGATGVEDRLQDDVDETMKNLRIAGMKIWVLTGDKVETALNVAQSCGHIPNKSEKFFLTEIMTKESFALQLNQFLDVTKIVNNSHFTLVMDGQSLQLALGTSLENELMTISLKCEAVICCRLSPLQKAEIVKLIKRSPNKPITAAIGDGANDISMIQEAHVGFGIFGKEGRQAARAADFSFSKFNMLNKVLLVHGHWYYERLATLIQYSFYKNIVFVNLMLFFQISSDFSTQSNLDSFFLTFYNLLFASAPILVISLTEHCHTERELLSDPNLYKNQCKNKLLSWKYFFGWLILGIYHSIILYYCCYVSFYINPVIDSNGSASGLWSFGSILFHNLVVLVNLKIWMHARYQTFIFIFFVVISIFGFMLVTIGYSYLNLLQDGDMIGVYTKLLISPNFWLINILLIIASLQPDFTYKSYKDLQKQRVNNEYNNNIEMTSL